MTALASWHADFPGLLAGSVYAAPGSRVAAAQTLADAGLDVHVDVMAVSEGLPAGVSLAELQMISAAVDRSRIGVHLIGSGRLRRRRAAEDPGAAPRRGVPAVAGVHRGAGPRDPRGGRRGVDRGVAGMGRRSATHGGPPTPTASW